MHSILGTKAKIEKEFARHEGHLLSQSSPALNPLTIFPSKSDTLSKAFFSADLSTHQQRKNEKKRWIHIDKVDPTFGLEGEDQETQFRRSVRRLGTSQAFVPQKKDAVSLKELYPKHIGIGSRPPGSANTTNLKVNPKLNTKYVLVAEDNLSEIIKYEMILQEEKVKLGEQCAWLFNDIQTTARIPVPAVRLAMHNLCEQEMKVASRDAGEVLSMWSAYSKKQGYNKSFLYSGHSYMNTGPQGTKGLKLKMMKEANNTWLLNKFRDTMSFEDDLSKCNERYLNAQLRRHDYDRYFILATRYGIFSEEEFYRDAMPGTRYYKMVTRAALMLQNRWSMYWPIKKLRMNRAARMFQTLWRKYYAYKRWHPIIVIRMRVGRRSSYKFCWFRWLEYNALCKKIREALNFVMESYVKRCFEAWHGWAHEESTRKKDILNRFIRRMKYSAVAGIYLRWKNYAKRAKHVKTFARRMFQNPHFHMWVQYTKESKYIKHLARHAKRIQALARGYNMKRLYTKMRNAATMLAYFGRIVLAKKEARLRRARKLETDFEKWLPGEKVNMEKRLNEKERRRLINQQQFITERENAAIQDIKRHLRKRGGVIQVQNLAKELRLRNPERQLTMFEAKQEAKSQLIDECAALCREIAKHDYNAKGSALYTCADVHCAALFTSEEQYVAHVTSSPKHCHVRNFAHFHILLRQTRYQDSIRDFLANKYGIDVPVNWLDCWVAIQVLHKMAVVTEAYVQKSIAIFETYVRPGCNRPIEASSDEVSNLNEITTIIERVKRREYEGVYVLAEEKPGFLRRLFRLGGRVYEKWTSENVIPPHLFNEIEYYCFMKLHEYLDASGYYGSADGQEMLREPEIMETRNRQVLIDLFIDYQKRELVAWSKAYLNHEIHLVRKAEEVCDILLENEAIHALLGGMRQGVEYATLLVRHDEQKDVEPIELLADDAIFWAEERILELSFEFYASAIITAMWEVPESRKSLLEFAGYLKRQATSRLLIKMNVRNEGHEWFEKFVNKAIKEEEESILTPEKAVVRITKRVRGMLARNRIRKLFVKVYVKRYDPAAGAHYYCNMQTGESSWDRPRFTRHLFPKSAW